MFHSRKRLVVVIASGISALGLAAITLSMAFGIGRAHASPPADDGVGTPTFITGDSAPPGLQTTRTIPYWSRTFIDPTNGVTYPYTMVGTDPYTTDTTTTIPVTITHLPALLGPECLAGRRGRRRPALPPSGRV